MVLYATSILLKGKNSHTKPKQQQIQVRTGSSSTSSSSNSIRSVSSEFQDEGNSSDRLIWPSKREDCEWVADKVQLLGGGKHAEVDSGAFRDDIVSYGVRPAYASPKKTNRKRRSSKKKTAVKASSAAPGTVGGSSKATGLGARQPLRDITLDKKNNCVSSSSASRPACTIPIGWHRALANLLTNSEKECDGPRAAV